MIAVEPVAPQVVLQSAVFKAFIEQRAHWTQHDLGRMNVVCSGCNALHWAAEKPKWSATRAAGSFESCCKRGDAIVEKLQPLPEPLNTLMTGGDAQSKRFREGLRHWNSQFVFTSISYNMDNRPIAIGGGF